MAIDATGKDATYVGRIRDDNSVANGSTSGSSQITCAKGAALSCPDRGDPRFAITSIMVKAFDISKIGRGARVCSLYKPPSGTAAKAIQSTTTCICRTVTATRSKVLEAGSRRDALGR
jgi:hypothetical protein